MRNRFSIRTVGDKWYVRDNLGAYAPSRSYAPSEARQLRKWLNRAHMDGRLRTARLTFRPKAKKGSTRLSA